MLQHLYLFQNLMTWKQVYSQEFILVISLFIITMAQQNIWKKQMLANKNKLNDSKVEVKPPEQSSQPPWVKNNAGNTPALNNFKTANSQTNSTQPPWVKNAVNPPQNIASKTNTEPPKAPVNSTPPWAKQNQEQSSTSAPPWAKQNKQTTNNSPPPWANKGATQAPKPSTQTPATNPPWAKSNSTIPVQNSPAPWAKPANTAESSTPAWANKNNNASQPAWSNKSQPATNPPWMKKEESPVQGGNSWKLKQMADIQKEKKQREEKMRQQQEQEKQAKRVQKLKRQRQQEQANIKRQLQAMQRQDQLSKNRQKFDKDEIERIQREKIQKQQKLEKERLQKLRLEEQQRLLKEKQEKEKEKQQSEQRERARIQQLERLQRQRLDLQNSKSKSKSTKKNKKFQLQTSKISHISSIRGAQAMHSSSINAFQSISPRQRDPNQPQNLFHRYTRLMNQQSSQTDYRNKVSIQKLIIQTQLSFKRQCQAEIIGLVQKKKITNRKRKIVFSNNMQIRYGLCEGKKGDNGLQFIKDEGQSLKTTFLHYQMLTNSIIALLKKKVNIHLRVPLINYAQYKGISFLIEYICEELVDIIQIDVGLFQQISNQILILEKQLQLLYQGKNLKPITKNHLMVKKINVYGYDYYILYIKQDDFKSKKLNSPIKPSKGHPQHLNLSYLKFIEQVASQGEMLPFYIPFFQLNDKTWQFYEKTGSSSMKLLLKDICLANAINTVYNSCQGEVQQNIFFDLVIEGNKQIWDMIKCAGFIEKVSPSPITLAYLQKISSVRFDFSSSLFSKKKKDIIQSVNPHVFIQRHEFEMIDFMKNLQKYILEDKDDLVQQSYKLNRQIWDQISKSSETIKSHGVYLLQIKQMVSYMLYKHQQSEAIELLQKQQEKLSSYAIERVSISLLFIKIYVQMDSQVKLLKKLSDLLQILQFYFKQQIILHSYVYTIVGSYYSKKSEDQTRQSKVITFYEHAIDIAIKIYGEKAVEVAEVYLSRANAMFNLNKKDAFQKDVAVALKIYKGHSKNNSKIAQCIYLIGKAGCLEGKSNEGIQSLQSSRNIYLKLQNYVQALNVSFELLRFLELDESKYEAEIQKIIQICFRYKSIWAFKKIIALLINRQLHCYTTFTLSILEDLFAGEQEDRTNEEILIDLQQQVKGFTSFIEIVRWSLSILAAKTITRKQTSTDYEKSFNIMRQVMHFYKTNLPPQVISQLQ